MSGSENRKRTRQVGVRLTPREHAAVAWLASRLHQSVPETMRSAALVQLWNAGVDSLSQFAEDTEDQEASNG